MPMIVRYKDAYPFFVSKDDKKAGVYPTIIPNWDHTPRSGRNGYILNGSTPELFKLHVHEVLNVIKNKPQNERIVFLKSWNEWGEGNYMEPDLRYGKGYIETLKRELNG